MRDFNRTVMVIGTSDEFLDFCNTFNFDDHGAEAISNGVRYLNIDGSTSHRLISSMPCGTTFLRIDEGGHLGSIAGFVAELFNRETIGD